ncbi:hypothetical protein QBC38DRAFT_487033 [Podospora fimiseda]|uniref:Uncharacterized protein n=1 Tax=Podospora fimiseda TaxID=252190 RepID=A0AAN7GST0_9PEZI|nr:hypothetical protein QBC38DRAFT_487033 [Podospora fimiseda]
MTAIEGGPTPPSSSSDQAPYVRLHVTPLDADLLKVIVSASILPRARNISYHNLENFPEKRYGFVDLPKDDADKLKKKFNGATLKGVKIRIEAARPSSIPAPLGEDVAMAKDKKEKKEKSSKKEKDDTRPSKEERKKRKREAEEIKGVVLENDRQVKRGWTAAEEPERKRSKKDKKDKKEKKPKKQERSKYTDHAECMVKTILPLNAVDEAKLAKKKKKGSVREVVIHEFEKTTKFPTFLKTTSSSAPQPQLEYVEDKGWVDEDGNLVEAVKLRPPPPVYKIKSKKKEKKPEPVVEESKEESDSDNSDDSEGNDGEEEEEESASEIESEPASPGAVPSVEKATPAPKSALPVSPSATNPASPSPIVPEASPPRPKSSGSARNLAIKIPPTTPSEPKIVHPLEALYKRPQNADGDAAKSAPEAKGFSFFGGGDDDIEEEEGVEGVNGVKIPMTPFTRQDFELRGIRSAAPTPDTAFPRNGRFKPWDDPSEDIEEDEEGEDDEGSQKEGDRASVGQSGDGDGERPTSDFQKWFWENRGDLNRSWRKRRKTATKEKRYRENKARMARAI